MKSFWKIWTLALVVKTALAIWLPLSNDEAYYWVWGQHPQLSYFDHPPMVGWLFWLGSWIDAFGNASRLPGVWLGHFTLLLWHKILSPYIDDDRMPIWLAFVLLSPFMGLGSLVITPDVPMLFFWSLSLLLLLRLPQSRSWLDYAALGAALGLGFCSKYQIVLFVPFAFVWLIVSGKWRSIRWLYVPATVVVGLAFCLPVLLWNYRNEWASFAFQLSHGFESSQTEWFSPLEYVGGQILLLFPPVAWLATKNWQNKELRFLHCFGWLPLGFFLYSSFHAHAEANWPIMGHPALLSLAFINAQGLKPLKITAAAWLIAGAIVLGQVAHPWLPIDERRLKTNEFHRFDPMIPVAESTDELYLGSYQMAAAVSYGLRRQIYKLGGMNRKDFYDFMPQSFPKGDRFYVGAEIDHPLPKWIKEQGYNAKVVRKLDGGLKVFEVTRNAQGIDR